MAGQSNAAPVIIKRKKIVVGGGHHGGAWKVTRPDSEARLQAVLDSANALTSHIGTAAETVQQARSDADDAIEDSVTRLNTGLQRIADLNDRIQTAYGSGRDASALMDQRQQAIDEIADIVPLRVVERDLGQVALVTATGATLLEGVPARIGFAPAGIITDEMTLASGALSGLTLNGRPIATAGDGAPLAGGSLAAQFAVRDEIAVQAQTQLDAVARDLVERFANVGTPGLFTDAGLTFDATNEPGLARRLTPHPAADPEQGGALWRLRDGLAATTPGSSGSSALLVAMQQALTSARAPVSGGMMAGARSFATLGAEVISGIGSDRLTAEDETTFATAQAEALAQQEATNGVDTDQELQSLMVMEQAYAANARVIQTIGEMIDRLLGM